MKSKELLLGCMSVLISGTSAVRCENAVVPFDCLFGCCQDTLLVYCCISNGGGIALIVTGIVVVVVTTLLCLRACRGRPALTTRSPVVSSRNNRLTPNTGYGNNISFIAFPAPQQRSPYNDPPPSYSEVVKTQAS